MHWHSYISDTTVAESMVVNYYQLFVTHNKNTGSLPLLTLKYIVRHFISHTPRMIVTELDCANIIRLYRHESRLPVSRSYYVVYLVTIQGGPFFPRLISGFSTSNLGTNIRC